MLFSFSLSIIEIQKIIVPLDYSYTSSIHIMKFFTKIYDISISAVELRHYLVKHKKLT